MRKRILTIKQNGKRIEVDKHYCKVGSVYEKPKQIQKPNLKK